MGTANPVSASSASHSIVGSGSAPAASAARSSSESDAMVGNLAVGEPLLEPVVRVRLVVELRYLDVAARAVERRRRAQRLVGVEVHDLRPRASPPDLELGELAA